jgi:hypothetical protein
MCTLFNQLLLEMQMCLLQILRLAKFGSLRQTILSIAEEDFSNTAFGILLIAVLL